MRSKIVISIIIIVIASAYTSCNAECSCDDWVGKGGYCVNYIRAKIPIFPIPKNSAEIEVLNNKKPANVTEGDVAIFKFSNYWHFAYIEKVHMDKHGNAMSVDISEMNFGNQMSFSDYKKRWGIKSEDEWKRAVCCGVTNTYGQVGIRKNIELNAIKQIWSPVPWPAFFVFQPLTPT